MSPHSDARLVAEVQSVQPGEPFTVRFDVENVGLVLPIATEGVWSRYRDGVVEPSSGRPRMRVHSTAVTISAVWAVRAAISFPTASA